MEMKMQRVIGAFVGLGTAIVIFVFGFVFDIIPMNKYAGVYCLCFLPFIIFFSNEHPERKQLINIFLSFVCGLVWGFIAVVLTPILKQFGGEIIFALAIYFVLMFLILFVHVGLLGHTVLNKPTSAFTGFMLSVLSSTTFFWSGKIDFATFQLIPIKAPFNQLDIFVIFLIGTVMTYFVDLLCGAFIGSYMKKKVPTNQAPQA